MVDQGEESSPRDLAEVQAEEASNENDPNIILSTRHFAIQKYIARERENILDSGAFRALSQFLLETGEVSYETFVQLRQSLPPLHSHYFSAKLFMSLIPDPTHYTVSSERLVRFIDQELESKKFLIDMLEFSLMNPNTDYITSDQLQSYLFRRIPDIDPERKMVESFYEFYTCTAVQRFLFQLDNRNSNQISIKQLVKSDVLQEFLDIIQHQQQMMALLQDHEVHGDRTDEIYLLREKIDLNWFSGTNAVNIYTTFLNLDVDQNGLLNLDEVSEFNGFTANGLNFTRAAWRRIFEELIVFAPFELDYRGFVHLVLALDDICLAEEYEKNAELSEAHTPLNATKHHKGLAGIRFFWNVVDFNRSNQLSPMKIKTFYADIEEYMLSASQTIPDAHAIIVEIFDMLSYKSTGSHPLSAPGPTFQHLIRTKRVATALMMLLDINSFWRYENRENPNASLTPPLPTTWSTAGETAGQEREAAVGESAGPSEALVTGKSLEEGEGDDEKYSMDEFDEAPPESKGVQQSVDATAAASLVSKLKANIVYDDEVDEYEF